MYVHFVPYSSYLDACIRANKSKYAFTLGHYCKLRDDIQYLYFQTFISHWKTISDHPEIEVQWAATAASINTLHYTFRFTLSWDLDWNICFQSNLYFKTVEMNISSKSCSYLCKRHDQWCHLSVCLKTWGHCSDVLSSEDQQKIWTWSRKIQKNSRSSLSFIQQFSCNR